MASTFLAHITDNQTRQHLLIEHLMDVKQNCEELASKIKLSKMAGVAGLLHDVGKYSTAFQHYLIFGGRRGSIKHSFVGAQLLDILLAKIFNANLTYPPIAIFNEVLSNSILSHHSELKDMYQFDGSSVYLTRKNSTEPYIDIEIIYQAFIMDIQYYYNLTSNKEAEEWLIGYVKQAFKEFMENFYTKTINLKNKIGTRIYAYIPFLTKTLYSILIEADRTDTAAFMDNQNHKKITYEKQMQIFQYDFELFLENHKQKANNSLIPEESRKINHLRQKMSDDCKKNGGLPTGIYQLPIPTGGGKTLSSIRFALEHAIKQRKDRIIYVVPYTSIVEQNAQVIREALDNTDLVFEHHSSILNPLFENDEEAEAYRIKRLKEEQTWDMPIIFTTAVQFLNTLFKNKSRYNRKMHNLMNAIIIFDEIQSLPPHTIKSFNESVNFLYLIGNTTIILSSATQPTLNKMDYPIEHMTGNPALTSLNSEELNYFERVIIKNEVTSRGWDTETLGNHISQHVSANESVLIILNTKEAVKALYIYMTKAQKNQQIYYLSTNLCAVHRQERLQEIKKKLVNKEAIICISTSLIEAGVDISFNVVYRSLTGLDSIAQAIGRCNRNGELEKKGHVYIFRHNEEKNFSLIAYQSETASILEQYCNTSQLLSKEAMNRYFKTILQNVNDYIKVANEPKKKSLYHLLFAKTNKDRSLSIQNHLAHYAMYNTAGTAFEVISSPTRGILVPYKVTEEKLLNMNYREQQRYSVNVAEKDLDKLLHSNIIKKHTISDDDNFTYILVKNYYHEVGFSTVELQPN